MRPVPAQLFSLYGLVSGSWCFCLEFPCTWKCGKGAASDKNLCRNDCLYRTACVLYRRRLCDQPDARGWTRGLDYIIVLGAQVRKDGPSPVLKYRLDKAVEYLNENPDTVCIVSGGQGSNEPWSEAEEWHGICRKKELILRGFCRKINRRQPSRISRTVKS